MGRRAATIMRARHDSENPYKVVRRATFEGSGLSFDARGVMAYLLMKPDDWEIDIRDLMREGDIGRDKTYKIIGELVEHRYLERVDERDKGKFGGATYLLHESPYPEKPDTVQPLPEKPYTVSPDTEKPYTENPQQTNKENTTKYEKKTKKGGEGSAPTGPDADMDFGDKPFTPQQTMFAAVCEAMGWDYRVVQRQDKQPVGELVSDLSKAGYTADDIRRFMVEVWFKDWRWEKRGERPKLKDIRQGIGALRVGLPEQVPRPSPRSPTSRVAASLAAIDEYERIKASHGVTT